MTQQNGLPYEIAQSIAAGNKNRIFANTRNNGRSGAERARSGEFPDIELKPKFKLPKDGRYFAIGSCFARNVEAALTNIGIDVITSRCLIAGEHYDLAGPARNGVLNAYTPQSMLQLVNWSQREDRADVGLLQLSDDEWCDMLVSGTKFLPLDTIHDIRGEVLKTYDALPDADGVFITLGFTEAWFDIRDQVFVNRSPGGSIRTAKKGDRYSFCNASPLEVIESVSKTLETIHQITNGRAKIIITTSPVPIHATFTGRDVISANMYSKSTLLSAAVWAANTYDFVDYYPSYEMVIYSNPAETWMPDGIHIYPDRVRQVVGRFADAYF